MCRSNALEIYCDMVDFYQNCIFLHIEHSDFFLRSHHKLQKNVESSSSLFTFLDQFIVK